ncbi:hypothetical protein C2E21_2229 [Chlorella sorokiniana]|uniref:Uncharacterized protein n=1 Tax=Chlorella sorokiniana TaxID=3076 RepID=A0A2P6TZ85_CHLSO|nr:hypothetical protein C2E21_2229 [Chlorella sorokiniana]|eukprot:PRW59374.1 hypothetical protein C2E21_2229 [Chlorella sorokiniana]
MDEDRSRFRDREFVAPEPAAPAERPQGAPPGGGAAAANTPLLPPGIGLSAAAAGGSPTARKRRHRGGMKRRGGGGGGGDAGPGGRGPGPGPLPPGMEGRPPRLGGGRGWAGPPPPGGPGLPPGMGPPPGSKAEAAARREERHREQRAALLKRQVVAMEVSPAMLSREDAERRDDILHSGPDVAPASSYEELPPSQHCYWADVLLQDHAQLQAPSTAAPGVDHAGLMAAALELHQRAPPGKVLLSGKLGDFAVDADTAALLASI